MKPTDQTTAVPSHGRPPNAGKPGQCGTSALLPGDDVAEFRRMRQEMYDLHRPRTGNEARCVDAMAAYEWGMERCRRLWSVYHDKLRTLVHGNPDGTPAAHCERDPHRWHHSAMDCGLDAKRLASLVELERRKLERMQKARRQNALDDAKARVDEGPAMAPPEDVPEDVLGTEESVAPDIESPAPLAGEAAAEDAVDPKAPGASAAANGKVLGRGERPTNRGSTRVDFMVDTAGESAPVVATFSGRPVHAIAQPHPHHPRGQPGAPAGTAAVPAQAAES